MKLFKELNKLQRRRTQKTFTKVSKTDQSYKKACCINNIVATYHKTGVMPQGKTPSYADVSEVPSFIEAFEMSKLAQDAFLALPATVRKLMDNDPLKLEEFISNKDNYEMCVKYGLLEQKQKADPLADKKTQELDSKVDKDSTVKKQGESNGKQQKSVEEKS